MLESIKINIASVPDRESLVAELFVKHEMWAEINQENGQPVLEVYPRGNGQPWILPLEDVLQALTTAKKKLVDVEEEG